jgi:hypothetical protein
VTFAICLIAYAAVLRVIYRTMAEHDRRKAQRGV